MRPSAAPPFLESFVVVYLRGYVALWLCSYVAIWLCGYVAMWLSGCTGGTGSQVVGEPPARATLTDLSSGLLEPQGKPGWGIRNIFQFFKFL